MPVVSQKLIAAMGIVPVAYRNGAFYSFKSFPLKLFGSRQNIRFQERMQINEENISI